MMPRISFYSTLLDGFPDLAQKERSRSRSRSPHIIEKNIDYKLETKLRQNKNKELAQKFITAVTKRGILLREDRNMRRVVIEPQPAKKFNCSQVLRLPMDFSVALDFLDLCVGKQEAL